MRRVVAEQRLSVDLLECRLTGLDRVQQLAERAIHLPAEVHDDITGPSRSICLQADGQVVERDTAILQLDEHTRRNQRPQDPAKLRGPRPNSLGNSVNIYNGSMRFVGAGTR